MYHDKGTGKGGKGPTGDRSALPPEYHQSFACRLGYHSTDITRAARELFDLFGKVCGRWRKPAIVLGALAYLALPLDFAPDVVPIAGQIDDAVVVLLAVRSLFSRKDAR